MIMQVLTFFLNDIGIVFNSLVRLGHLMSGFSLAYMILIHRLKYRVMVELCTPKQYARY